MRSKVVLAGTIALIALAGLAIWALGAQKAAAPQNNTTPATSQTTPSQQQAQNNTNSTAVTITYTSNGFDKSSYNVKAGEPVTLRNNSANVMQFSSDDHPTHLKNPELNLASLGAGQSTTFTPTKVGSWGVHDHLDPSMRTTLVVSQ